MKITELIAKEKAGKITDEELIELHQWVNQSPENLQWYERWSNNTESYLSSYQKGTESKNRAREKAWSMINADKPSILKSFGSKGISLYSRLAAAAVVLLVIGGIWYHYASTKNIYDNRLIAKLDVKPGGNKAVLTLSDGHKIVLDSAGNGTLATQAGTTVTKNNQSLISYVNGIAESKEAVWNTISTPIGGQFSLLLPDGSKVWLNSGSSLRFPTAFVGTDRKVILTGEGYFEIESNKNKPFQVEIGKAKIEVLGTHFDILGYSDEENLKATLLQGSIRVTNEHETQILTPGQQANIAASGKIAVEDMTNAEGVKAWVGGDFSFFQQDIKSIMKQLSRWYDVDITYDGEIPNQTFTGVIARKSNISGVLLMLQNANILIFKIEVGKDGRNKVIVHKL